MSAMTANEMWKELAKAVHPDRYEGNNKKRMDEFMKKINVARDEGNIETLNDYYNRYIKIKDKRNMGGKPKRGEKNLDFSMAPSDADDFRVQEKKESNALEVEERKFVQSIKEIIDNDEAIIEIKERIEEKLKTPSLTEEQRHYLIDTQNEFALKLDEIFEAFKNDIQDAFNGKVEDPDSLKKECLGILTEKIEKLVGNCNKNLEEMNIGEKAAEEQKDYKKMAKKLSEEINSFGIDDLPRQYKDKIKDIKITLVKINKSTDIKDQEELCNGLIELKEEIESYKKNKEVAEASKKQILEKVQNAEKLSKQVEEWDKKYNIRNEDAELKNTIKIMNILLGYIRKLKNANQEEALDRQFNMFKEKFKEIENFVYEKTKNVRALFEKLLLDQKYKKYIDDNGEGKDFEYSNLNIVEKAEDSDEVVNNFIRRMMFDFVVHGVVKNENEIYRFSDLDGKSALEILKLAGFDISKTEYVRPGETIKGNVSIDTGGREGTVLEEDDSNINDLNNKIYTLYLDHHGQGLSNTSATKIVYELLVDAGLIEKKDHLDDYVEFVNKVDNADWDITKDEYFNPDNFSKTLLGLKNYFKQDISKEKEEESYMGKIIEHFENRKKTGKTMREIITEVLDEKTLGDLGFDQTIEYNKQEIKITEAVKNRIRESKSALDMLNKLGLIFKTSEYGNIVLNINRFIPNGNDAALPYGCKTIVSPGFISSNKKDLSELHKKLGGVLIRGCMLKPAEDKTLKDILQNMLGEKEYEQLVEEAYKKSDSFLTNELRKKIEAENGKLKKVIPEKLNEILAKWEKSITDWPQNSNKVIYGDGIFNNFLLQVGDQEKFNEHKTKVEEIINGHIGKIKETISELDKLEALDKEIEKINEILDEAKKELGIISEIKKANEKLSDFNIQEIFDSKEFKIGGYVIYFDGKGMFQKINDAEASGNIMDILNIRNKYQIVEEIKRRFAEATSLSIKDSIEKGRKAIYNLSDEEAEKLGIDLNEPVLSPMSKKKISFKENNKNIDIEKMATIFRLAQDSNLDFLYCKSILEKVKFDYGMARILYFIDKSGKVDIEKKENIKLFLEIPHGLIVEGSENIEMIVGYMQLFSNTDTVEGVRNLFNLLNITFEINDNSSNVFSIGFPTKNILIKMDTQNIIVYKGKKILGFVNYQVCKPSEALSVQAIKNIREIIKEN